MPFAVNGQEIRYESIDQTDAQRDGLSNLTHPTCASGAARRCSALIIGHNYRFLDNALAEVDLVLVRENGVFRQSHFFGSPEQRAAQFVTPDQRY